MSRWKLFEWRWRAVRLETKAEISKDVFAPQTLVICGEFWTRQFATFQPERGRPLSVPPSSPSLGDVPAPDTCHTSWWGVTWRRRQSEQIKCTEICTSFNSDNTLLHRDRETTGECDQLTGDYHPSFAVKGKPKSCERKKRKEKKKSPFSKVWIWLQAVILMSNIITSAGKSALDVIWI